MNYKMSAVNRERRVMETVKTFAGYTTKDIEDLPAGERAELIDGQIYMMAAPGTTHQRILNYLSTEINLYIRAKGGNCEVFPAPFAVYLNKDDRNYIEPDISVICDGDKLDKKGCHGAPDWIVEVVSPGNADMDYAIKLFKYRTAGVREYWLVDYGKNRTTVYNFQQNTMKEYSFNDIVQAGIYEDFAIDFSRMKFETVD